MSEQSSMHAYLNWTKQRIDEMDVTLASLEAKAGQVTAESKVKADQLIADLKKRRDEFQATVKAQLEAAEATVRANKAQLESQWPGFEAQVKAYFDAAGKQVEQQQLRSAILQPHRSRPGKRLQTSFMTRRRRSHRQNATSSILQSSR